MEENTEEEILNFHEMEIDDRVLKAIAKLGWKSPTLIQERAISLLLEGKDVLVRARTGSGKTAAFAIPVIQKILNSKRTVTDQQTKALILAPSRELCHQIYGVFKALTIKCSREVNCVDISPSVDLNIQKPLLLEKPDIVIGTPGRALQHIKGGNLHLKTTLEMIVIDEADLVFSFGYEKELKQLMGQIPNICQAVLASATLSNDVKSLKSLVLHNPVILKLEEPDMAPTSQLAHYHLSAEEMDKAAILYTLIKLNLIRGKTIIFVNTVDKCYKIKLYLEQFAIRSCVLNSELPATVRCHSVNQFNQDVYDIIVASDEKSLEEPGNPKEIKKSKRRKDKDSGVSRGIDFQHVSNVINFDFPLDKHSYIHRAGRTARGNNEGSVLSFVSIKEKSLLDEVEKHLESTYSEGNIIKAYQFKLDEVESFRYRAKDAWKAVTRIAVREARLKEIKQEIFNSQKLKSYFEDNPNDLRSLRHDKALHTVRVQQHLANVPEYIVPTSLKKLTNVNGKKKREHRNSQTSTSKFQKRQHDPLIVDFVATSCIQLAKERIIKYSDTKYNINDFKTGDCETMLLNQRIYYLNKSKSKWISVGLQIGSKTLTFEIIKEKKILRIEDVCGNEVYLAIDLKSAVERLYEKLGALGFDADHEAIYGMEKYYTVEQCEKLRDKYKIERKVCRQFLKGCLVKRISDIGLQHFLDTISKYIKDCSDSDTSSYSSDDEECKEAVEQNGEDSKTTEEEESKKSGGGSNTKPFS
ncbi:hypothetical protein FQA39_LY10605 [Lamprigera yunnana]|nr:hypothetical protein FQA39_LY10605 [Lamprigera yunnana]